MGLIEELDYRVERPNPGQRVINRIVGTWPVPRLIAPLLPRLDRLSLRPSGGSVASWGGGRKVLWVQVVGARSGEMRRVSLLAFPIEGNLAVIGSNFGRSNVPTWTLNLRANPDVELEVGGRKALARAREASEVEAEAVWATATHTLPPYATYRKRVTDRAIPVFIFEPRPDPDAA